MKLSSHLLAAWATAIATALTPVPKECGDGRLYPNNTMDLPAIVNCTHRTTYQCLDEWNLPKDEFLTFNASDNATTHPECSEVFYDLRVSGTGNFDGSLVIPDLVKLNSVDIGGKYYQGEPYLTLSTIDLPDLVNITRQFVIRSANNVSSLTMPKLEIVDWRLYIDLSGGPAINLTFPSLSSVGAALGVKGNIDGLEFPALTHANLITVESTGDLDCAAFAASVVNATVWFGATDELKDSVICSSNTGSIRMHLPNDSDSSGGPSFRGNMLLLAIFASCASLFV